MTWLFAITLFAAVLPPEVQPAVEQAMAALEAELPEGAELQGVSIQAERGQVRLAIGGESVAVALVEAAEPGPGRWVEAEGRPATRPWSAVFLEALHAASPANPWIGAPADPDDPLRPLVRAPPRSIAPWRSQLAAGLWLLLCLGGTVWALRARPESGTMPP